MHLVMPFLSHPQTPAIYGGTHRHAVCTEELMVSGELVVICGYGQYLYRSCASLAAEQTSKHASIDGYRQCHNYVYYYYGLLVEWLVIHMPVVNLHAG